MVFIKLDSVFGFLSNQTQSMQLWKKDLSVQSSEYDMIT